MGSAGSKKGVVVNEKAMDEVITKDDCDRGKVKFSKTST